jgi:hypothetical protein
MPKTERDEILAKYAKSQGIEKEASELTAYRLATELGIEAALLGVGGALAGGGAVALITGGLATSATGIGFPVGVILTAAGVAYTIYNAINKADNTVAELIDRLEDLDYEGTVAERAITTWIMALKRHKKNMSIPGLGTDAEVLNKSFNRVLAIKALIRDLEQMNAMWPQVKANVEDWKFLGNFGDVGEAEVTLKQTLSHSKQLLEAVRADAQSKAKAMQEKVKQKFDEYVEKITPNAQKIINMYGKLAAAAGGRIPKFDNKSEEMGWNLANSIVKKEVTMKDFAVIQRNLPHMTNLQKLMEAGLEQLGYKKESSNEPALSKRALTLGTGEKVKGTIPEPSPKGYAGQGKKKGMSSRLVLGMQKIINNLRAKYNPTLNTILEDGVYGPETGEAIASLIVGNKLINKILTGAGFTASEVRDYNKIKKDPGVLRKLYALFSNIARKDAGVIPKRPDPVKEYTVTKSKDKPGISSRTRYYDMKELMEKHDPEDAEIDALIKEMMIKFKGRPTMSAYDYLRLRHGIRSMSERAELIRQVFDKGRGLPAARWWIDSGAQLRRFMETGDKYDSSKNPAALPREEYRGKYNILF